MIRIDTARWFDPAVRIFLATTLALGLNPKIDGTTGTSNSSYEAQVELMERLGSKTSRTRVDLGINKVEIGKELGVNDVIETRRHQAKEVGGVDEVIQQIVLPLEPVKQKLPLDCEAQSAADVARYLQAPLPEEFVSFEEYFRSIPVHDNPNKGYRGNIRGSQWVSQNSDRYGYGVHAQPIAEAFGKLGVSTRLLINQPDTFELIRGAVAEGKVAMVWIYSPWYGKPFKENYVSTHTDPDGEIYTTIKGEHVMVARGVSAKGEVLFNDPYTAKAYWKNQEGLEKMEWDEFGYMTLIIG